MSWKAARFCSGKVFDFTILLLFNNYFNELFNDTIRLLQDLAMVWIYTTISTVLMSSSLGEDVLVWQCRLKGCPVGIYTHPYSSWYYKLRGIPHYP